MYQDLGYTLAHAADSVYQALFSGLGTRLVRCMYCLNNIIYKAGKLSILTYPLNSKLTSIIVFIHGLQPTNIIVSVRDHVDVDLILDVQYSSWANVAPLCLF